MERSTREALEDFLRCPLCCSTFQTPISLACNHSFCKNCLSEHWKDGDKACPSCKRKSSIDKPPNFALQKLADRFAEEEKQRATQLEDLVDWQKPLAWQVGHLGEKYDDWVYKPVDRPIRLFESELLEANTRAEWYLVPAVWLPVILVMICYGIALFSEELEPLERFGVPLLAFLVGLGVWCMLVYGGHSMLHKRRNGYYTITLHFLVHGQHHKNPRDTSRLVFPPGLVIVVFGALYMILRYQLPEGWNVFLMVGIIVGYFINDMAHYYLHCGSPSEGSPLYPFKKEHLDHHNVHENEGENEDAMLRFLHPTLDNPPVASTSSTSTSDTAASSSPATSTPATQPGDTAASSGPPATSTTATQPGDTAASSGPPATSTFATQPGDTAASSGPPVTSTLATQPGDTAASSGPPLTGTITPATQPGDTAASSGPPVTSTLATQPGDTAASSGPPLTGTITPATQPSDTAVSSGPPATSTLATQRGDTAASSGPIA